jgi:hypothetical protein
MKSLLAIGLLATVHAAFPAAEAGPARALTARVTLLDGSARTVTLEGLGCTIAICSRTVIKGVNDHHALAGTRLDSLAAIRGITPDSASLLLKSGGERRITLVKDFRVLYLEGGEKLDLTAARSVEFVQR